MAELHKLFSRCTVLLKEIDNMDDENDDAQGAFHITDKITVGRTEIIPGWEVDEEVVVKAATCQRMNQRLNVLITALWTKEQRNKLILKKTSAQRDRGKREIKDSDIEKLMRK